MVRARLPTWTTVATTATASAEVEVQVCDALCISKHNVFRGCLDRPNIFLSVSACNDFPTPEAASYTSRLGTEYIFPLLDSASSASKFLIYGSNLTMLANVYLEVKSYLGQRQLVDPAAGDNFANHAVALFSSIATSDECALLTRRLLDPDSGLLGVVASPALGLG